MESLPLFAGQQRSLPAHDASVQSAARRESASSSAELFSTAVLECSVQESHCRKTPIVAKATVASEVASDSDPDRDSENYDGLAVVSALLTHDPTQTAVYEVQKAESAGEVTDVVERSFAVPLLSTVVIATDVSAGTTGRNDVSSAHPHGADASVPDTPVSDKSATMIDLAAELPSLPGASQARVPSPEHTVLQVSIDALGNRIITRVDRPPLRSSDTVLPPPGDDGQWTEAGASGGTARPAGLPPYAEPSGSSAPIPFSVQAGDAGLVGLEQIGSTEALTVSQSLGRSFADAHSIAAQGSTDGRSIAVARGSDSEPLTTQISRVIQSKASTGELSSNEAFRLQLSPPSLGTVQVRVDHGEDGLHLQIRADGEVGRAMLASRVAEIRQQLQAQHVTVADIELEFGISEAGVIPEGTNVPPNNGFLERRIFARNATSTDMPHLFGVQLTAASAAAQNTPNIADRISPDAIESATVNRDEVTNGSSPADRPLAPGASAVRDVALPPAVPMTLSGQVTSAIHQHLASGAAGERPEVTFRLDPPELGALRIRFLQTDSGIQVRVQVQNDVTLHLLQTRGAEIEQALKSLEISADRVIFEGMSSSTGDSSFASSHDNQSNRGSSFDESNSQPASSHNTQRVARRQSVQNGTTASTLLSFRA